MVLAVRDKDNRCLLRLVILTAAKSARITLDISLALFIDLLASG